MQYSPVAYPLSFEKQQRISLWTYEVHNSCSSGFPSPFIPEPLSPMEPGPSSYYTPNLNAPWQHQHLHQYGFRVNGPSSDDDCDKITIVFDVDKRYTDLPNPSSNPLVTSDPALLKSEYTRVINQRLAFELELWHAQRMLRGAPSNPDNIQRVDTADHAVEAASEAVRYIEAHVRMYKVPLDLNALFFKTYKPIDYVVPEGESYGAQLLPQRQQQQPLAPYSLRMGQQSQQNVPLPTQTLPQRQQQPLAPYSLRMMGQQQQKQQHQQQQFVWPQPVFSHPLPLPMHTYAPCAPVWPVDHSYPMAFRTVQV
ncbi:hypothetical protein D9611_007173 [Ephemerocybe angulata]|uniref:Uncharacterized protein n=1 Tax=Ephemerocybe angulata TaxID=980116 RepID=A0A8H5B1F0_9AGAR|nr:hypothetical protein D9611_007173 [Tulosesus angulatus]